MGIRSLTYLDIPAAKRQENASRALARLRDRVNDPMNSPEQTVQLSQQIAKLEQWASGTLKEGP